MRICLITPFHISANPRLVKEADALSEAGHDVTVISTSYTLWGEKSDKAFATRSWRTLDPPLTFGPRAPLTRRFAQLVRYHGARWLAGRGLKQHGIIHAAWNQVAPDLTSAARKIQADLYIAHYPAALPAAAIAAHLHGGAYAFDAEDFHLGDPPDGPRFDDERMLTDAIERRYLPGCAYVTASSPGIADAYAATYPIARPTVVLNVFPRAQAPSGPTPRGSSPLGPSVYWFSQTIGANRGLEAAVGAIGLAKSRPHLFLRGTPNSSFLVRLRAMAREVGAADRLHVLPPGPPEEMARLASEFDIGLAAENIHSKNRQIALTNKLFTYLLAGMPVLASDIEAHRDLIVGAGASLVLYRVEDSRSLATAIDCVLASPENLAAARAAAFELARTKFNWDLEKHKLIACVDQLFGDRVETQP